MSAVLDPRPLDPRELQGNILRGYRRQKVRHLLLAVADGAAARAWLGAVVSGDAALAPQITSEAHWGDQKPDFCFNLGITSEGLRALGLPESVMASFPGEFNEGMAARAVKLGDTGASAPSHWPAAFRETDKLHLIATIHADDIAHLDAVHQRVQAAGQGRAWQVRGAVDGGSFKGDEVHFGYRDNISQPRFVGIHDPADYPDAQPLAPLGTVLLGKATAFEDLVFTPPQPAQLGLLGSFSAFRVLAQDVVGFEAYLDSAATELLAHPLGHELLDHASAWPAQSGLTRFAALREVLAAKMCGRWRTGVPLALSPDDPHAMDPTQPVPLGNFDYQDDPRGLRCPYGAHLRRCNPRGSTIVQRMANHTRRIVRRGIPYGPAYDRTQPHDGNERGLLGHFVCANLAAQFEAIHYDWLNLGLQDPRITGSNDPLLGANDPLDSWFDMPVKSGVIRLRGLPRFVTTRGGAYLFLPSLPALRYLAGN